MLFKGVLPLPAGPAWVEYTRETTSDIALYCEGRFVEREMSGLSMTLLL